MNTDEHLRALWQASDPVDTDAVLARVRRMETIQRRVNHLGFFAGMFFIALIVFAEGRLGSLGGTPQWWVPIGLSIVILASWLNHLVTARRVEQRLASGDPSDLLCFARKRAKAGLWLARGLYAFFPLGVAAGVVTSRLVHGDDPSFGLPMAVRVLVLVAALAGLVLGAWQGLRLARLRREDIDELTRRIQQTTPEL